MSCGTPAGHGVDIAGARVSELMAEAYGAQWDDGRIAPVEEVVPEVKFQPHTLMVMLATLVMIVTKAVAVCVTSNTYCITGVAGSSSSFIISCNCNLCSC